MCDIKTRLLLKASGPCVLGDGEIGLEAHLTGERRKNFTGLRTVSWEGRSLEEDLEEYLGITVNQ
jgi:hypothetical protein